MISKHRLAEIASLVGDPSRAAMLHALGDGRALPAGALAREAGVSAATASAHLAKLAASGLIRVQAVGRHRYFRIGSADVGAALEALERLIPPARPATATSLAPDARALREARLCYDHLAGALGVSITRGLVERRALILDAHGLAPGARASVEFARLGVDVDEVRSGSRTLVRTCIDWTERREHLSGALGAAVASACFEQRWIRRAPSTRIVRPTTVGRRELAARLGVTWE